MPAVVNLSGEAVDLKRLPENAIAKWVRCYAGPERDPVKLKRAISIVLRRVAGLTLQEIGTFVDDHRGHVSRMIRRGESEMRQLIQRPDE